MVTTVLYNSICCNNGIVYKGFMVKANFEYINGKTSRIIKLPPCQQSYKNTLGTFLYKYLLSDSGITAASRDAKLLCHVYLKAFFSLLYILKNHKNTIYVYMIKNINLQVVVKSIYMIKS